MRWGYKEASHPELVQRLGAASKLRKDDAALEDSAATRTQSMTLLTRELRMPLVTDPRVKEPQKLR